MSDFILEAIDAYLNPSFTAVALFCLGLTCAGSACGGLPPKVVQGGVGTIELAICIANTAEHGYTSHEDYAHIVADCMQQCGTDAATITRVLDANAKLSMAVRSAGVAQ